MNLQGDCGWLLLARLGRAGLDSKVEVGIPGSPICLYPGTRAEEEKAAATWNICFW